MQLIDLISSNPLFFRYKNELLGYENFDDLYNSIQTKLRTLFNSTSNEAYRRDLELDLNNFDTFFIRLIVKINNELYQLIFRLANQHREQLSVTGQRELDKLLRVELPNILQLYNPHPRLQLLIQFESYFLTLHCLVNVINIDLTSNEYLQKIPDVKDHLEDHLSYFYKQLNPYYSCINGLLTFCRERKENPSYSLLDYVNNSNETINRYHLTLLKSSMTRESKSKLSIDSSSFDSKSTRSSTEHTQIRLPLIPCRRIATVDMTNSPAGSSISLPRITR